MQSTPQFQSFLLLPIEIRLKIWHLTLQTPRTIFLSCRVSSLQRRASRMTRDIQSYSSSTPVPALLHTNRESRHEALCFYSASFTIPRSLIYISFTHDTLHLSDHILVYLPPAALGSIRHMVLDVRDTAYFEVFNMECLRSMDALEDLELLVDKRPELTMSDARSETETLIRDFGIARRDYPEWDCPRVRITTKKTLDFVADIGGGAGLYSVQQDGE